MRACVPFMQVFTHTDGERARARARGREREGGRKTQTQTHTQTQTQTQPATATATATARHTSHHTPISAAEKAPRGAAWNRGEGEADEPQSKSLYSA